MARQYLDFDLAIEATGDGQYVARVLSSPAGEAEAPFEWPFSPQDLEIFVLRIGHTRRGTRRSDSPEMQHARDFGRTLYDTVFAGPARTALIRSIDEAERRDTGLRIRLRLGSSPQLNDVPWEYLYSEDLNRFLIVSAETPIVRYVDLQRRVRPVTVELPLHILAVVSAPADLPDLDVEGEWSRLEQALERLDSRGSVTLERLGEPTLEKLQERLRRAEVHVLHFIGHGAFNPGTEEGVLFFANDRGGSHAVTGEDLGTVLHDHRSLRLVVLNSCEGARSDPADPFSGSAQALVGQGIPAVIAMQFEITDKAALTIAKNFYGSLADGYAVDAALAEARKAIFSQGNDVEWGTPVLYMRAPDGQLFDIGAVAGTEPAPVEAAAMASSAYEQAHAAADQKDWTRAISLLEKVVAEEPDRREAVALLESSRRHQLAANLYRGAGFLAAAEQWDAVLERFRDIEALAVEVDDPEDLRQKALDAIETRRQTRWLNEQLERARSALTESNWPVAKESAESVLAEHPSHAEALRIATEASDRAAVSELYDLARTAAGEERWDQVLKRFEEIEAVGRTYLDDQDELRPQAVAGLAAQARLQDLDTRYEGALALIDAGQWDQALSIIDALATDEPGFRGVELLRDQVASEVAKEHEAAAEAAAERRYVDAIRSAAANDWEGVIAALDEIEEVAPGFGDPESLRSRAESAIEHPLTKDEGGTVAEAEKPLEAAEVETGSEDRVDTPGSPVAEDLDTGVRVPRTPAAAQQLISDTPRRHRRWAVPPWLPGVLLILAADLRWATEWRRLPPWPVDLPLGYLIGLPELAPGGLNIRVLVLGIGMVLAIQPYRYPGRPAVRRWAAAAAIATVIGVALSTALLEDGEIGAFVTSTGPWLSLVVGAALVRTEPPAFVRVPEPKEALSSHLGGVRVNLVVGLLLISIAPFLPWWASHGEGANAFEFDWHVFPGVFGREGGLLGLALLLTGVVGLAIVFTALLRKRAVPSWISLLGVSVFVYAATFQALWVLNIGSLGSDFQVVAGAWAAALGGLLVAVGHRLGKGPSATLALLSGFGFLVWRQAAGIADEVWGDVSSSAENWALGLVGLGAAALVALAVALADMRVRKVRWRDWTWLAMIVGVAGAAGYALFALGESSLDSAGGYWGSMAASMVTLMVLARTAVGWEAGLDQAEEPAD